MPKKLQMLSLLIVAMSCIFGCASEQKKTDGIHFNSLSLSVLKPDEKQQLRTLEAVAQRRFKFLSGLSLYMQGFEKLEQLSPAQQVFIKRYRAGTLPPKLQRAWTQYFSMYQHSDIDPPDIDETVAASERPGAFATQ